MEMDVPSFPCRQNTTWYVPTYTDTQHILGAQNNTRCARAGWRNLLRVSLIFAIIVSFMLFNVFPLVYVLYFEEFRIHDSRGFMILKNN